MNVYLSGQGYFGRLVLKMLMELRHDVAGVSAPTERRGGGPDRLWTEAERQMLPLMPAGELREKTLPENVDLLIAAHSHDYISRAVREKCRIGAVGYHPSLLPLHRGRDAVYWTIKLGDPVAGGTVFWLNDQVDGGPVAAQDWCFVRPGWTARDLWRQELQPMGLRLLQKVMLDTGLGKLVQIPQDHELATWEPSVGRAPLFRPDLPQLGTGPDDFQLIVTREMAREV